MIRASRYVYLVTAWAVVVGHVVAMNLIRALLAPLPQPTAAAG